MPAPRMNTLEHRKQLLLMEAGVHRAMLQWRGVRWSGRTASLRNSLSASGPWLLVGGALGGWVLARNWRRLAAALPLLWSFWRGMRR